MPARPLNTQVLCIACACDSISISNVLCIAHADQAATMPQSQSKTMVSSYWRAWSPSRLSLKIWFYCVLLGPLTQKLGLLQKSWDSSSKHYGFQLLGAMEPFKTFPENWVLEDIWVYSLLDMSQNLREIDQELQGGYMSIFLIRYVLKAWGSRPWAPKKIYEYIPYQILFKILRK